ncbi:ATP-binding cassette domain-containing protein [Nocardia transvalensis]|nr:ATP-binding cassette domain-containing protein [Nocardia transvalensis]MBF6329806.1 ATP-binding cassette domain-containing protein [Nocardia transvalensis]
MSSDAKAAVQIFGLRKAFGEVTAIDGLDLTVRAGGVYSILGPNGAGKTTLLRVLATLLRPDDGSVSVFGHDVVRDAAEVRAKVSVTGQDTSVDEDLTGVENLTLIARLLGFKPAAARRRATALIEAFDLADAGDRLLKTYSGGMRRRVDIAASLVVTPDLLFLDEPTTGLDPRSRNRVWDVVRALVDGGTTVLLTTQNLDEADRLADRVAVLDHGRLVAEGTPGELKARTGSGTLQVRLVDPARGDEAQRILSESLGSEVQKAVDSSELTALVPDSDRATRALAELSSAGVAVSDFALGRPSLDEVFLSLTGHVPTEERSEQEASV